MLTVWLRQWWFVSSIWAIYYVVEYPLTSDTRVWTAKRPRVTLLSEARTSELLSSTVPPFHCTCFICSFAHSLCQQVGIAKVNPTQFVSLGISWIREDISLQRQKLDWQLHSNNVKFGGQERKSRQVCCMELTARGPLPLTFCSCCLAFTCSPFSCSKMVSIQLDSPQS